MIKIISFRKRKTLFNENRSITFFFVGQTKEKEELLSKNKGIIKIYQAVFLIIVTYFNIF